MAGTDAELRRYLKEFQRLERLKFCTLKSTDSPLRETPIKPPAPDRGPAVAYDHFTNAPNLQRALPPTLRPSFVDPWSQSRGSENMAVPDLVEFDPNVPGARQVRPHPMDADYTSSADNIMKKPALGDSDNNLMKPASEDGTYISKTTGREDYKSAKSFGKGPSRTYLINEDKSAQPVSAQAAERSVVTSAGASKPLRITCGGSTGAYAAEVPPKIGKGTKTDEDPKMSKAHQCGKGSRTIVSGRLKMIDAGRDGKKTDMMEKASKEGLGSTNSKVACGGTSITIRPQVDAWEPQSDPASTPEGTKLPDSNTAPRGSSLTTVQPQVIEMSSKINKAGKTVFTTRMKVPDEGSSRYGNRPVDVKSSAIDVTAMKKKDVAEASNLDTDWDVVGKDEAGEENWLAVEVDEMTAKMKFSKIEAEGL